MKLYQYVLMAGLFSLFPFTAHAYITTSQNVRPLGESSALYSVTYRFGMEKYGVYLPIMAVRNRTQNDGSPIAGYLFKEEDDVQLGLGQSTAVVISDATIVGNQYYIPPGKVADFTLVALLSLDPKRVDDRAVAMQVSALPFSFESNGALYPNKLNPSELTYYTTPFHTF